MNTAFDAAIAACGIEHAHVICFRWLPYGARDGESSLTPTRDHEAEIAADSSPAGHRCHIVAA